MVVRGERSCSNKPERTAAVNACVVLGSGPARTYLGGGGHSLTEWVDVPSMADMNKRHWNTVALDGSVPAGVIRQLLERSYALVSRPASARRDRTRP